MHAYLVMTVDSGLYLTVENEDHELVLQVCDGRVEAGSHQSEVSRQVRAENTKRRLCSVKSGHEFDVKRHT